LRLYAVIFIGSCLIAQAKSSEPHRNPHNTSAMARHYGHGTPLLSPLTDMAKKPFVIEPFKGHWTLLYFWADWCVPYIEEGIPALTSFVKQTPNQRDSYRIVAIRFNSLEEAGDWTTFKSKTEHLERTLWHGVPPFPIVYDSSTRMTSDWGVHELPTYALIDPQGNLVPNGNLSTLRAAIGVRKH
jgi:thiol-disulfide isomerase/thioredoxin